MTKEEGKKFLIDLSMKRDWRKPFHRAKTSPKRRLNGTADCLLKGLSTWKGDNNGNGINGLLGGGDELYSTWGRY